jgi:hypothetical protein
MVHIYTSERPKYSIDQAMEVYRCDHCAGLMIEYYDPVDPWGLREVPPQSHWLPVAGITRSYADVPKHINSLAVEAGICLQAGANRGAVILARSVVEATAKDKGITTGSLLAKIDRLRELDLIREHIREAAHEVRLGGNDIAHADPNQEIAEEEAADILKIVDEILLEVYQSPARVERVRQARLARQAPEAAP